MRRLTPARRRLIRLALMLASAAATPAASQYYPQSHPGIALPPPSRTIGECIARTRDASFCGRIYRQRSRSSCYEARKSTLGPAKAYRACNGPSYGPDPGLAGVDNALAGIDAIETNALLGEIVESLDAIAGR